VTLAFFRSESFCEGSPGELPHERALGGGRFRRRLRVLYVTTGFSSRVPLGVRAQNEAGMNPGGVFVNAWVLRASANVIAYLVSLGFPLRRSRSERLLEAHFEARAPFFRTGPRRLGLRRRPCVRSSLRLFYLETERVWVFLSPLPHWPPPGGVPRALSRGDPRRLLLSWRTCS